MIKFINLPRELCHFLLGAEHKTSHRMIAGVFVMGCGVGTAKAAVFFTVPLAHISLDMIGYFIHAVGAIPFIEYLMSENRSN